MKQNTPPACLNIRGKPAVFSTIYSRITMHNIMQVVKAINNNPEQAIHSLRMPINFPSALIFYSQGRIFTNPLHKLGCLNSTVAGAILFN